MRQTEAVLAQLAARGFLLQQDTKLPNVVSLLTGESLRGSWWSHSKGRLIFAVLSELQEHPDVLFAKLLLGKETLVHRRLWPQIAAIAMERAEWQMRGLSAGARRLLHEVDAARAPIESSGAAAKELRLRLLAVARDVHTASGSHASALESWTRWCARSCCRPATSVAAARVALETAASDLGAGADSLPWRRSKRGSPRIRP